MIIEPRVRKVGSGEVRRLLPWRERRIVGPFIFFDLMGPERVPPGSGMDVDAHPHIGLSTLTYLVRGRLVHRDSLGTVQTIDAGGVNWMTAGDGVCHTERTAPEDRVRGSELFGLQLWVALPEGIEDAPPSFEHCPAGDVPVVDASGATVRVAAGSGWGVAAPVSGSSPLVLADVELRGGSIGIDVPHPELAVVALDGEVHVGGDRLPEGWMTVLDGPTFPALSGTGRVALLGGEPLGRRHVWWNFVHSDPERIEAAKQRWRDQAFPLVPGDHDPFAPLPEDPPAKGAPA